MTWTALFSYNVTPAGGSVRIDVPREEEQLPYTRDAKMLSMRALETQCSQNNQGQKKMDYTGIFLTFWCVSITHVLHIVKKWLSLFIDL